MPKQPTLSTLLRQWSVQLDPVSDSARLDAEILFMHASGLSATQLVMQDNEPLNRALLDEVQALVEKRLQGQPIAYLVGEKEFYSLSLRVNQHVLIPRPETELLVERALEHLHSISSPTVLDLGTGSGAIALAVAANAPGARLFATDIEPASLDLAKHNAARNKIDNVNFILSDWFASLDTQTFDLILSNPPYIDSDDPHLEQGDVRFEPRRALIAMERGLADITHIIAQAPAHLKTDGLLALEHGYDQGEAVRALLLQHGFIEIQTLQDLNGLDRVSLGRGH